MKSFRSIAFVLAGLAAACAYATDHMVARAARTWHVVRGWTASAFDWIVSLITTEDVKNPSAPRRALIGAAQFLGRMVRRDRPVVSPRWRMCPSV